jgi:hypothetical protein
MARRTPRPSKRPQGLQLASLHQLYVDFERLFLASQPRERYFESPCCHQLAVFDHNFFHFVKLWHPTRGVEMGNGEKKFRAAEELPRVRSQIAGFGSYTVDRARAQYLPSAHATFMWPDGILELRSPQPDRATHVFYREFDHAAAPFTAVLVKREDGRFVPVTSFPCDKRKMRNWREKIDGGSDEIWGKWP